MSSRSGVLFCCQRFTPTCFFLRGKAREHPKDVDALIEDWLADFGKELSPSESEWWTNDVGTPVEQ